MVRKYTGWGVNGKPFTQAQYKNSYLKSAFKYSYSQYLKAWARQYKNKRLRKTL